MHSRGGPSVFDTIVSVILVMRVYAIYEKSNKSIQFSVLFPHSRLSDCFSLVLVLLLVVFTGQSFTSSPKVNLNVISTLFRSGSG